MYGESDVVRKHAGRLREQGADLRVLADQLVARAERLHWTGRAADAMRERVRERATRLREAATRHDTAATSLETHGQKVDGLKDAILDIERRAEALVSDARNRLEGGRVDDAGVLTRPTVTQDVDRRLTEFDAPARGHKSWLSVDVPGLDTDH